MLLRDYTASSVLHLVVTPCNAALCCALEELDFQHRPLWPNPYHLPGLYCINQTRILQRLSPPVKPIHLLRRSASGLHLDDLHLHSNQLVSLLTYPRSLVSLQPANVVRTCSAMYRLDLNTNRIVKELVTCCFSLLLGSHYLDSLLTCQVISYCLGA